MIKFFRQIRLNLMETGKTSPNDPVGRAGRYFKYAIGEIILVVIGILIALQINTWNQERLNKIEAKTNIKAIYNDIVNDTLLLSTRIKIYEKLLKHNTNLITESNSETANLETLMKVAENFDPTFYNIESFNNSTFSSIESTGKLDLINQNLKKELLEYKLLQEACLDNNNVGIYLNHINNFTSKYKFGALPNTYLKQLNSTFKDEQEYVNLLSSLIEYKNFMLQTSLSIWNRTLTKAKKNIALINTGETD